MLDQKPGAPPPLLAMSGALRVSCFNEYVRVVEAIRERINKSNVEVLDLKIVIGAVHIGSNM